MDTQITQVKWCSIWYVTDLSLPLYLLHIPIKDHVHDLGNNVRK